VNTGDAAGDTFASIEGLVGSDFNDVLTGDAANNALWSIGGDDTLQGGAGNDSLWGGDGWDRLEGGAGADQLDGEAGFDYARYMGAASGVTVSLASPAVNTGDAAGDTFASIEGLVGSDFNDVLIGDAAGNALWGIGGNDILRGGAGSDSLWGGDGSDTFDFDAGTDSAVGAEDTIGDFVRGGDRIDLSTIDANSNLAGDQAFTFLISTPPRPSAGDLRYGVVDGITTVYGDVNGDGTADFQIKLLGAYPLSSADFIL
jgi:serralysin